MNPWAKLALLCAGYVLLFWRTFRAAARGWRAPAPSSPGALEPRRPRAPAPSSPTGGAMTDLLTADNGVALLTLTCLEIVLGIDNIVFISILTQRLPEETQAKARQIGLGLAMLMRVGLLFAISWIIGLVEPLFGVFGKLFSGRDMILLGGGLFLVGKATHEIHNKLEGAAAGAPPTAYATLAATLIQITLLDIVFSLDSVITAVGMAREIAVMVAAIVTAVGVMMLFASAVSRFIERHPTMKILALSFLILIGVILIVEGFGGHVQRGYIYFAMAFSLAVELVNQQLRRPARPGRSERPGARYTLASLCADGRPEDCAGPLERGADGRERCDAHADAYASARERSR